LFVVDDEQLAAGLILPPQPDVAADGAVTGVELDECAHEHRGGERVGGSCRDQLGGEATLGQLDPVDREARLEREPWRQLDPAAAARPEASKISP